MHVTAINSGKKKLLAIKKIFHRKKTHRKIAQINEMGGDTQDF